MGAMADWQNGGFGIYIHWPFCAAKCPYCDFNSHVHATIDYPTWEAAYLRDLSAQAERTSGRCVDTIFFGGGTPSLMPPNLVAKIIDHISGLWDVAPHIEITLEANPTSVEAEKFIGFKKAGVNRISMGIQALNDDDLKRLGRLHTAKEAKAAFELARSQFSRVSFDLIYARQNQTLKAWAAELREALSMSIDHLSLYQLTIEPQTAFGNLHAKGRLHGLPNDGLAADMYDLTQDICDAHNMPAYEVSNHAPAGSESRHNLIYWRYGDYIGIGPGAHGRITTPTGRIATEAIRDPIAWLNDQSPTTDVETISSSDQAAEYLMMSLRLSEGSDVARFESLGGAALPHDVIVDLSAAGLLRQTNTHIIASQKGRIILNSLLRDLLV